MFAHLVSPIILTSLEEILIPNSKQVQEIGNCTGRRGSADGRANPS